MSLILILCNLFICFLLFIKNINSNKYISFLSIILFSYLVVPQFIMLFIYESIPVGISVPYKIYSKYFEISVTYILVFLLSFLLFTQLKVKQYRINLKVEYHTVKLRIIYIALSILYISIQIKNIGGINNFLYPNYRITMLARNSVSGNIVIILYLTFLLINFKKIDILSLFILLLLIFFDFRLGNRRIFFVLLFSFFPIFVSSSIFRKRKKLFVLLLFIIFIWVMIIPIKRSFTTNSITILNVLNSYEGNGVYSGFLYRLNDKEKKLPIDCINEGFIHFVIDPIEYLFKNKLSIPVSSFSSTTKKLGSFYTKNTGLSGNIVIEVQYFFGYFGCVLLSFILNIFFKLFNPKSGIKLSLFILIIFPLFRGDFELFFENLVMTFFFLIILTLLTYKTIKKSHVQ